MSEFVVTNDVLGSHWEMSGRTVAVVSSTETFLVRMVGEVAVGMRSMRVEKMIREIVVLMVMHGSKM